MKFYEKKYKFTPKEVRPFAQHTNTKENNPIYNEKLFEEEVRKVKRREEEAKREQVKRYREMAKGNFRDSNFMKPIGIAKIMSEIGRN
jgi:hypothetical protein